MDVDTTRLRSFLHVAELGTVAAAAHALGFTGPAVSQHVSKLETQLGVPLFMRAGGRLSLSVHGERLLPIASEAVDLIDLAAGTVAAPVGDRRVAVAGFASAIRTIVLPAMEQVSGVEWEVSEAEDDDALRSLRLGAADVAIVQAYSNRPNRPDPRLRETELACDPLLLVAPPRTRRNTTLAALASSAWLVNGTGTRCEESASLVLAAAGIAPRVVGRIADSATLFALVAAGLGATLAPERMIGESRLGVVVSTTDLGVTRRIVAVQRRSSRSINADIVEAMQTVAAAQGARAGGRSSMVRRRSTPR